MLRSSKFAVLPYRIGSGLKQYVSASDAERKNLLPRLEAFIENSYQNYHLPLEKEILAKQLGLLASKSNYSLPELVAEVGQKNNNDFTAYTNAIFDLSLFSSKERALSFLQYPDEAIPDANSTLRLSYGKVRALPADKRNDANENNYTTFQGMIKKYKPNDSEFDLDQSMLDIYEKKDYGRYANERGQLPVNFLTDNDITGGNSGSPVVNGKGELIGLAFDGNIEAMAGDVIFDKDLQRTINVDIRSVLWLIDKYSNAKHIVDELTIITKK